MNTHNILCKFSLLNSLLNFDKIKLELKHPHNIKIRYSDINIFIFLRLEPSLVQD